MFKTCKISRKTDTRPIQILGRFSVGVKTSRSTRRLCRILSARERTRRPYVLPLLDTSCASSRRRVDLRHPEESRRVSLDSDIQSRYTSRLDSCTMHDRCPSRIYIVSNVPFLAKFTRCNAGSVFQCACIGVDVALIRELHTPLSRLPAH